MDPEKKSLNFIFPTKYVIPKILKFSHWPSKLLKKNIPSEWDMFFLFYTSPLRARVSVYSLPTASHGNPRFPQLMEAQLGAPNSLGEFCWGVVCLYLGNKMGVEPNIGFFPPKMDGL